MLVPPSAHTELGYQNVPNEGTGLSRPIFCLLIWRNLQNNDLYESNITCAKYLK